MDHEERIALGFGSWSVLCFFAFLWSTATGAIFVFVSAVVGLYAVLPKPQPRSERGREAARDNADELQRFLEEAEYEATRLAEIDEKYGSEKREKVEELLRQKQALAKMEGR